MIGLSHQPQYVPAFSSIPGFGSNGKHNIHRRRLKFKGKCAFLPPSFFVGCFCSYKKKSVIISERWDSLKVFHKVVCHRRNISSSVIRNDSFSDSDVDPSGNDEDMFAEKSGHLQSIKKDIFEFTRSFGSQLRPGSYQAEILFLALPAIIGQAIEPMAQLAETAYIGRLGAIELASAGVSITIFNIISKLFNVPLLSITTSFVAKDISIYSNHESISDTMLKIQPLPSVSTALLLSLCIGTIEGLALLFGAGQFLKMLGVAVNNEGQCPNYKFGETKKIKWEMSLLTHQHFPFGYVSDNRLDILPQEASPMYGPAQQFLSLRALGTPAVVVSLAIQGIFRGFKDTRTPLLWIGFGNLSAVCMLPIFLYTLQLGLNGAAVATVASQYITTVMLIWALSRKALLMPPRLADLQFGGYIKSGSMLLGRTLSVLITMTLGTSMAARQGPVAMAAHQICLQVWLAVSLLSDALALSAQAIIASSFAKHDHKRVKDIASFVLKCGMLIGMTLAIVLSLSFGSLAHLFTKDSNVLQIVKSGILFVSASQPINAIAFIFDGLHYGVSDFSYAACSMMVVGAISSVFLLYVPSKFGLPGVWSGLTLFMTLRMVAGFLRLKWKNGPWNFLQEDPVI